MKKRTIAILVLIIIALVVIFGVLPWMQKQNEVRENTKVTMGSISRTVTKECGVDFDRLATITADQGGEVVSIRKGNGASVSDGTSVIELDTVLSDSYKVKSTISGQIAKVFVRVGEVVSPGAPLFTVLNRNTAKVVCSLSDVEYADVQRAQGAKLFKATTNVGNVRYDLRYRTLLAFPVQEQAVYELELGLPEGFPREQKQLGFTVSVTMQTEKVDNAVLIPLKFLGADQQGEFVTMEKAPRQYEKKYITTGITDGTNIAIKEGLSAGDTIYLNTP